MNYKIVGWRLLIKPKSLNDVLQADVPEFLKEGGFEVALPQKMEKMVESATIEGEVVSVGPWAFKAYFRSTNGEQFECPVKVGDEITYARYAGQEWIDPDTEEKYTVLNDEDVHCIKVKGE